jgi:tRNA(fMet)-specific endonuclease VapC
MLYFDNSVLSRAAAQPPDESVAEYLHSHKEETWALPATVAFEYLHYYDSTAKRREEAQFLRIYFEEITPFSLAEALEATEIAHSLAQQDVTLATADLIHVATARANGGTFVTADANDFDGPAIHQLLDVDIVAVSDQ